LARERLIKADVASHIDTPKLWKKIPDMLNMDEVESVPVVRKPSKLPRLIALFVVVALVVTIIIWIESSDPKQSNQTVEEVAIHISDMNLEEKEMRYEKAKEITTNFKLMGCYKERKVL